MTKNKGVAKIFSGLEPWPLRRAGQGYFGDAFSFWESGSQYEINTKKIERKFEL